MKWATRRLIAVALICSAHGACQADQRRFYETPVEDAATRMRARDLSGAEHVLYEQSHALLIGQVNYTNWSRLPAVRREILDLRNALERHRFKVEVFFDLATAEFASVVDDFMRRRASVANSRIFVYVSGHGWRRNLPSRPAGYVVPVDAPSEKSENFQLASATIGLPLFAAWAQLPDPRHMLFIFDACFSGSFFGRPDPIVPPPVEPPAAVAKNAAPQQGPVTQVPIARGVEVSDYIFQPVPRDRGRQFMTAGSASQIAPPDSVFTRLLIDILEGRRVASTNFDNWTTGRSMGIWLEQNTRREYRGKANPTTPVFGTLRDSLYENGDIVFTRMDVPNPFIVAEDDDPFPKLIAERLAGDTEEVVTAKAVEKLAAQSIAEDVAKKLNERALKATEEAETARAKGKADLQQLESLAIDSRSAYETARAETEKLAAESQASLKSLTQNRSDVDVTRILETVDASAKRIASLNPPNEARLSETSERALQSVVDNLSSNVKKIRRDARIQLADILTSLPTTQRGIATGRLLQDFASKSYRYQIGVATALAIKPEDFVVGNGELARQELEISRSRISDKTLNSATSKVLALEGLKKGGAPTGPLENK